MLAHEDLAKTTLLECVSSDLTHLKNRAKEVLALFLLEFVFKY